MSPFPLDRRAFLGGSLSMLAAPPAPKLMDIHVHLFGLGDDGTGCRMSKKITSSLTYIGLVFALGLRKPNKTMDGEYRRALLEHIQGSGLTQVALLGQDAAYKRGKPDWDNTHFYTPNDYVFEMTARHPKLMVPCPSINPDRDDAVAELERCHGKGARVFKIHPPTQGVDLADRKHLKFFRRCAALGMVVMVHTGHEHSAPIVHHSLASPLKLEQALDEGCTVVASHAGTGRTTDKPDMLPHFLLLLKRYKNLWADTSILGTSLRAVDFRRVLADPLARARLLHGSDFPFPTSPKTHAAQIGAKVADRIAAQPSWIGQDFELKKALGVGVESARRSYDLLHAS